MCRHRNRFRWNQRKSGSGKCRKMQELFVYLLNHGFTMNEVEHIAYKNARRVIREVL